MTRDRRKSGEGAMKGWCTRRAHQAEVNAILERALRSAAKLSRQAEQLAADLARFRAIHPLKKDA
jgi:hypothetical protein